MTGERVVRDGRMCQKAEAVELLGKKRLILSWWGGPSPHWMVAPCLPLGCALWEPQIVELYRSRSQSSERREVIGSGPFRQDHALQVLGPFLLLLGPFLLGNHPSPGHRSRWLLSVQSHSLGFQTS